MKRKSVESSTEALPPLWLVSFYSFVVSVVLHDSVYVGVARGLPARQLEVISWQESPPGQSGRTESLAPLAIPPGTGTRNPSGFVPSVCMPPAPRQD